MEFSGGQTSLPTCLKANPIKKQNQNSFQEDERAKLLAVTQEGRHA